MTQKCALVMAGGTGGHIFPGLAVADALRARGWRVHWLGAPASMEAQLVPPRGYPFEAIDFGGVLRDAADSLRALAEDQSRSAAERGRAEAALIELFLMAGGAAPGPAT